MRRFAVVFLALAMILSACGTTAADQEARGIETPADAKEWVSIFLGEHPEDLDGAWRMTSQMKAASDRLGGVAELARQLSSLGAILEIGEPYEGEALGQKAFFVPCVFSGMPVDLVLAVEEGAVSGLTIGSYNGGKKEEMSSDLYDSQELPLPVPSMNGELPGTLTVPRGEGPFPAVVLIHGSGASDRDESVGRVKPFRDLAEGLAEKGVAVYRFDKRTYVYGPEMASDPKVTLESESIEDAVNAVQLLGRQDRIDPGRIYVLGHSLGGNAVPAIARGLERQPVKARGFIMMAASPRPLDVLMREQYDFLYSLMPEITPELQAQKDALFSDLDRLKDPDALGEEDQVAGAYSAYWKWLAAYDILQAAEEITLPCLLLQGEEDYQVTMTDFGIWKDTLGGKENWRMISYPGLTHLFTPGKLSEGSAVYAREAKMDPGVIGDIAAFVAGSGND